MWPSASTHLHVHRFLQVWTQFEHKGKVWDEVWVYPERQQRDFVLNSPGHFLTPLALVKTPLWIQLFFSLTVSSLMFIFIISSLFMGAVNLYLGAVHPNSGHWIIGQVSIRPLTGHKNWFGSESSGKVSGKNVLNLLLGQNISTRTMKNWKGLDTLTFVMKFTAMAVFRVRHSLQTHCTLIMHLAAAW